MMRWLYEENSDDVASDVSSDLFKLENLTVVEDGFSDELPVMTSLPIFFFKIKSLN